MKGGGLIPHWITQDSQPTIPTLRDWNKMKEIIDLDNRFDDLIEREEAEREIIGKDGRTAKESNFNLGIQKEWDITKPATEQAKKMEGAYVGFQPKPAVEIILVVSKGKTLTWLDDCRIPYQSDSDVECILVGHVGKPIAGNTYHYSQQEIKTVRTDYTPNQKGRFLLIC